MRSVRTSATGLSGHRQQVWQDTGGSAPMLKSGYVQGPPRPHRPARRPADPRRGRRPLRRPPLLCLQAQSPLRRRRRGRVPASLTPPQDQPDRDRTSHRHADHRTPLQAHHRGPGRRARHHRLAPPPPPRHHRVGVHRQPLPDPRRAGHPNAEEATQVVLPPVRRQPAQRDLAGRLHPLPAHPTQRHARRRRRGPDLAGRPQPLRPGRDRPPARDRPDRARPLPGRSGPLRCPGLDVDR